jgi:hypothetical protein
MRASLAVGIATFLTAATLGIAGAALANAAPAHTTSAFVGGRTCTTNGGNGVGAGNGSSGSSAGAGTNGGQGTPGDSSTDHGALCQPA